MGAGSETRRFILWLVGALFVVDIGGGLIQTINWLKIFD